MTARRTNPPLGWRRLGILVGAVALLSGTVCWAGWMRLSRDPGAHYPAPLVLAGDTSIQLSLSVSDFTISTVAESSMGIATMRYREPFEEAVERVEDAIRRAGWRIESATVSRLAGCGEVLARRDSLVLSSSVTRLPKKIRLSWGRDSGAPPSPPVEPGFPAHR